jgi:hypothetical protein
MKVVDCPVQTEFVPLIEAVGAGLTTTEVVAVAVHPPVPVTVIVYDPEAAAVALEIDGFCDELEKPLGPLHE